MSYYLKNIKEFFGKKGKFLPILLGFLLSTKLVSASTFGHEQNDCNKICTFNHSVEDYQFITSENIGFNSESSKCIRPDFFNAKEKSISVAIEKQNIFPSQNCFEVELVKQIEDFVLSNNVYECDFSNQKSYIKLGGVECVGKVARVAAKTGTTVLEGAVESNFTRFVKKIPANSRSSATFKQLKDGNYLFEATSPGRVPGSKAVYQKWVNSQGETIQMLKTTFGPDGKIIHVKPK